MQNDGVQEFLIGYLLLKREVKAEALLIRHFYQCSLWTKRSGQIYYARLAMILLYPTNCIYSEPLLYDHLVNMTTLLLQLLFYGPAKCAYIFL